MFSAHSREHCSSPPVISSPLRKLQRPGLITESAFQKQPPTHNYNRFDLVLNLTPNQILGIQEDGLDYVCGVETNGRVCRKSFYCGRHSLDQRRQVSRSVPLECLIAEESKNVTWFRKRRRLSKIYNDCKAYWQKHPSASMTPMTCSRTSCMKEDSNTSSSPRGASLASFHGVEIMSNSQGAFSSLKAAFLKRLSRSADEYKEDVVSYLFYRLACYEVGGVEIRARELEARYNPSETDFSLDSCDE